MKLILFSAISNWKIFSFVDSTFNGIIAISETDQKESNLLQNTLERNNKVKSKSRWAEKIHTFECIDGIYDGGGLTNNPNYAGLFKHSFFWGWGWWCQFDTPPSYLKKNLI